MKGLYSLALLLLLWGNAFAENTTGPNVEPVAFSASDGKLQISIGEKPFCTFVYEDEQILRPYFCEVRAPNGEQVSRNHPPIKGKDAEDHAAMHPGIWLAFGDLSGADFWRNKGRVRFARLVQEPKGEAGAGSFVFENSYEAGGRSICTETCTISVAVRPHGYVLAWDSTFSPQDDDFYFGDQEEMGLGIRIATSLTAAQGGTIRNSEGLLGEAQVWGKPSNWCQASGAVDGQQVGVVLMPHPENFRPSWFHARDYGLLVANPFGQNAFTGGEKSRIVVGRGEKLRLRFGILVYRSPMDEPLDVAAAYQDYLTGPMNDELRK
jgi:hypothetical protein